MFLTTVLFLGGITAIIEIYIFMRFTMLRKLIEMWVWLGIIFSFSLAILLCAVFGAHGVTVMFAGFVSLLITQPIYMIYNAHEAGKLDGFYRNLDARNWGIVQKFGFGNKVTA